MAARAQLQLGGFAPAMRPELGQWHTPTWLAERLVRYAGVRPGDVVLEPSIGGGNIARACLVTGARVVGVEIDPAWAECMRADPAFAGLPIVVADFLALQPDELRRSRAGDLPEPDLACMNPPLDGGVGTRHVAHALEFVPRVVSVLRSGDLSMECHWQDLWSWAHLAGVVYMRSRPKFGDGDGAKSDFVVVDVRTEPPDQLRPTEWWP